MLAQFLGISCSMHCERLLAFTCLRSPDKIMAVAHSITNDLDQSAIKLARRLESLPKEVQQRLCAASIGVVRLDESCAKNLEALCRNQR